MAIQELIVIAVGMSWACIYSFVSEHPELTFDNVFVGPKQDGQAQPQAASQGGVENSGNGEDEKSDQSGESGDDDLDRERERLGAPPTQPVQGGTT